VAGRKDYVNILRKPRLFLEMVRFSDIAIRPQKCPLCGISLLVRFAMHPVAVRCIRCGASAITMALVETLEMEGVAINGSRVYELSSRGPLVNYLAKRAQGLTVSEYFDGVLPGSYCGSVQCQDVQNLTYHDECFDVVTSTEVFEHVPDDMRGFREIRRVLKPDGCFVFTVPLSDEPTTIERAKLNSGEIDYLLPAEYHGDAMRGSKGVLVFRDYGRDIADRLIMAGFASVKIDTSKTHRYLDFGSCVIVART
jgi:SAM-dependent methyltransferase